MKQLVLLSLCFTAFFTACSSRSDNNPGAVTEGAWRVSHFSERGDDETGDFSGYTFTFAGNGSASAVKQGAGKSGSWSLNSTSTRFSIDFGPKTDANKPLGELTDNWMVISLTDREIKLTDDNAGSAEFLTFTKN